MTTTTPGRAVDAGTLELLADAYANLVRAGTDSVRAAWRFGQTIDSFTDHAIGYTMAVLADAMGLSASTLYRYRRFYAAYQTPELAIRASKKLETFNIDIIWELQNQLSPVDHRPLAGRRFRTFCTHCRSSDVARVEIDPQTEQPLVPLDELIGAGAGGGA
jgi:transcriptional regulator with XRE-family HTH domain